MVFLDNAKAGNGAMSVFPGSRLADPAKRNIREPTGLLVNESSIDGDAEVTIKADAGSVLLFPSLIVHRPGPNRSHKDRRALLFCFQPAGRPTLQRTRHDPERLNELP